MRRSRSKSMSTSSSSEKAARPARWKNALRFRGEWLRLVEFHTTLGATPATNAFPDVLHSKAAVSQKCHVPLIDLTPDLTPEAKALYLDADPVHLNATGNKIMGWRLFEVVSPLLKP